ncbi:MAG: mannosyltransferase [Bacteroidetes bacterium GWF2_38_335]|nr:MAG: mannosyltransferase [Bacteroidetes bacterium GWF2_38_335]OFY79157.1 MAG: mannosyltransferase [Bacteroidetes bacterium RIFOXYA12_FULL_38_20]
MDVDKNKSKILFITSFPPRECGIATYSQDLIIAHNNKFSKSFSIDVCALETKKNKYIYPKEVKYILNTSLPDEYTKLANTINNDANTDIVVIQHEFGLFQENELSFISFLNIITKPIIIVFHTVLPNPSQLIKMTVKKIISFCESVVVMTKTSEMILTEEYQIAPLRISVIPHGTHLVKHLGKGALKAKYGFKGKKVLTTFGLLSSGKSIETTLDALPVIVKKHPEIIFLIIGKTHPEVIKNEGEIYRDFLEKKVKQHSLQNNVVFINEYLDTANLLEYLQLTDIYLFTSNDPNQAVSGTFVYAMSCGCPIISTPIPHAREILADNKELLFDFGNSDQLSKCVCKLLNDEPLRKNISLNNLQKIISTAWQNSAVAHAQLFVKTLGNKNEVCYNLPEIDLRHLKKMTTDFGLVQFSKINHPDISTGYTLDDNARALIAMCMYLQSTNDATCIKDINKYLNFINYCSRPSGDFLNYLDKDKLFTNQNSLVNLDDANGRAIWALGYVTSLDKILPAETIELAEIILLKSLKHIESVRSTRSMGFAVKGLYYYYTTHENSDSLNLIKTMSNRLVQMFLHESKDEWEWFEGYLTYANSILPEAMLCAWLVTKDPLYKFVALSSFNFLLSKTFNENGIEVISNRNWLQKGQIAKKFGEQPIDVAYTIMSLEKFYKVFNNEDYCTKMKTSFNWFLGKNRLNQIVYNPCTGGCYDGLEETNVNMNQGAESLVSYLMARFTIEKYYNVK